jgi:hypothetical protein
MRGTNRNLLSRYQVAREIRMHSQLLHENIVRLYCAWKDSQFIHVAEEYAPHGDIYSLLKPRNAIAAVGVAENFVVTKVWLHSWLVWLLHNCPGQCQVMLSRT